MGPRAGLDLRKISSPWDSIPVRPARSSVAIPTGLLGPHSDQYIVLIFISEISCHAWEGILNVCVCVCVCVCACNCRVSVPYAYTVIPRLTSEPANEFFG